MYITSLEELNDFVARAELSHLLCIDTEFLREKTYYAKLCLLQIATDDEIVLIDPIAIEDLSPLISLLNNESIVKVFHAGQQDLEIILHETGILPKPIFDTQVAATLLGYTQQIGYAALVSSICHVTLKKADSFTDWSKRPLTESQLDYAKDDVVYLPKLYEVMTKRLQERGRLAWLEDDFAEMSDTSHFEENDYDRYKRLKRGSHLTRRQISAAREVAAWREKFAKAHNIPRKWVLTDEQIVEACKREPRTIDDLFQIRGVREKLSTSDARDVLKALDFGLDLPEDKWPQLDIPRHNEKNVDIQIDAMMALVRLRAKENDVALQTLVSHKELESLARGYRDNLEVLKGWRKTIIGNELLDFLAGKIWLGLDENGLVVESS